MVNIVLKESRLLNLLGLEEKDLNDVLFNLKSEVEKRGEDELEIEINSDRLDMLSPEGIKRAVDGILGRKLGEAKYEVVPTNYQLIIDDVESRPYALAAVVYDIKLDEDRIKEIIQFQEKLHCTIGRKRKKVAIGIHDLDKIDGKVIRYSKVPLDYKFVPLNSDKEMSVSEVISSTEQGKLYGNISIKDNYSPAILQEDGQVLSIPPIINSNKTKIDSSTKNLFIDVTGTNFDAVAQTLDLLVSNFAEGGSKIGTVKVSRYTSSSPLMIHNKLVVKTSDINKRLGLSLSTEEIAKYVRMMRMDANINSDEIEVIVPQYRIDIMTYVDIAEDVAMAYGYKSFSLPEYTSKGMGELLPITKLERAFRDLAIGGGFQEIFTFVLNKSSYLLYNDFVKIQNPITVEYDAVRNSLIWNMLKFLAKNQHARFPIKVFEVGDVVVKSEESDTGYKNDTRACLAIMNSKISYEELQSVVHQILYNLKGKEPRYLRQDKDYFIKGRSAKILFDNNVIGEIGEISPEVLEKFNIENPVVIAEIYLEKLCE
ncbi:phenylalanine--tRNA ligase subunit beta [Acidianus ambivalens]|uniref:Phenylalanine--tRNA ligase beta subunit n=1 Tax=Acidianus ambivalens TaxID=2283 RepID=A0A650CWW4_ACIAM|nr:phenylalanine--tRNA ligase subunit beta [Acidianus ambivalens]MQL54571.1 phenylalanine--tRNA ligase subunit beta [Acidianus ambivalens]QGR22379.1 phenylalanine--tRNA ligase subunit beta [Acidianus ambivalens]